MRFANFQVRQLQRLLGRVVQHICRLGGVFDDVNQNFIRHQATKRS